MFYAVVKGRVPGIYLSWETCKEQVVNYSGAVYKKFQSPEEAAQFIASYKQSPDTVSGDFDEDAKQCDLTVYVDGSYNEHTGHFGFGAVLFDRDTPDKYSTYSKRDDAQRFVRKEAVSMRNVAGELAGAIFAVRYAIHEGKESVCIFYDYAGIEKWATKEWSAKNAFTQAYAEEIDRAKKKIRIVFAHVKGHSGDRYNDMADKLAKMAVGIS